MNVVGQVVGLRVLALPDFDRAYRLEGLRAVGAGCGAGSQ
jgi:hypothetical protein